MQGGAQRSSIQNPGWLMTNVYYRWLMVVIRCTTQYKYGGYLGIIQIHHGNPYETTSAMACQRALNIAQFK